MKDNLKKEKNKIIAKLNSLFSPRKLMLVFIIIVAVITVPKLQEPAMSKTDAIVTQLCLDKEGEDVVMAVTVLSPGQDNVPNYQVFSGKGATLGNAIDAVSIAMGKELGFAQCEVMAIGENMCKQGIMESLDFMTRTKKVGRNAFLIAFGGDVKDFSQAMADLSKEKSLQLETIMNFDRRYIVAEDSNIESFYIGYFSDISLGILPKVSLETEEKPNAIEVKGGDSSSSGGGSGGGSGSGGGTGGSSEAGGGQSKFFVNDGTVSVFKKGKQLLEIPSEMVKKINYFVNNSQQGTIIVKDVNDKIFDHADVVVDIVKKKNDIFVRFDGNTPVYSSKMQLVVAVEEVLENEPKKRMLKRNNEFLTNQVIEKLKQTVIADMQDCVDYCKQNNIDVLEVYNYFYKLQNKKFEKYLQKTGKENYLAGIKFEFEIKVSNEY